MKKKLLAVALSATMVVSSVMSVCAELVTTDTTFDSTVVADGTTAWNSAGTGKTFPINYDGVTVVFENDGLTRDTSNWSNFVIETIATADAKGITLRADAYGWTYADGTDTPSYVNERSWIDDWNGDGTNDDFETAVVGTQGAWVGFTELTDLTDVTINAKQTSATTVDFLITFASDDTQWQQYTVTYPNGVPSNLSVQYGADGGKVTLKSATFGENGEAGLDVTGAQARTNDDTTVDLAFVSTIDKELFETATEVGVIIKNCATAEILTMDDVDDETVKKCPTDYVTTDTAAGATDSAYAFRTILTNVEANIDSYTAVPYAVLEDGTTVYGDSCVRNVGFVQ